MVHYDKLFSNQQFGFRTDHRTTDSLFILKTLILKYVVQNKKKIYACFVDLRKAFDTVWHNGLLYKLMKNQIGRKFFNVIQSMYSSCESAIKFENKQSNYFKLDRGVKQGDSLSPTLFNCFINDLHETFNETCDPLILKHTHLSSLSFADDLVLLSESHSGLQNALNKLQNYCLNWQLTVNTKKTKVLTFQKIHKPTPILYYDNHPLEEVKEYNFLGTIIDHKGSLKKGIQELSKKGLKVIFSLRKLFSNFTNLPINLSCKLFDTLIRPILCFNCEVWFMDDYLSIYRAMIRAVKNNANNLCDSLALQEKSAYEKVHTRYCKAILGLNKSACNISSTCELGRLPISSFIITQVMMYFVRLNSQNINPLLDESYNINISLHEEGFYTWHTQALALFKENNLNSNDYICKHKKFEIIRHSFKKQLKKIVLDKYKEKTMEKVSNFSETSKLHLYSKLKHDLNMEEYLIFESSFKNRQLLSKFRTSDHCLLIETGRHKKIPRQQRLCTLCNTIDDEFHFFLHCNSNIQQRNILIKTILDNCSSFFLRSPVQKLDFILNPTQEIISAVCLFIKQSLELRNKRSASV